MNDIGFYESYILNMVDDKDKLKKEFKEFYILNDKESSDDKDLILYQKWHIISQFMESYVFEIPKNLISRNYRYEIYEQSIKNLSDLKVYIESIIQFNHQGKIDFPLKDHKYSAREKKELLDLLMGFFAKDPADQLQDRFARVENIVRKNYMLYTSNEYQNWRRTANWVKDAGAVEGSETTKEYNILFEYLSKNF